MNISVQAILNEKDIIYPFFNDSFDPFDENLLILLFLKPNMTKRKQIAQNTMYLYIRMFLVMIVSLYTVRVVIKTLGVVDYGIFTAVGGIVLMMSFLSQTITFAAQRFFSFELGKNNKQRLRELFSMVLMIYVISAVIIAIIAEIAGIWFLENKMIIPEDRMEAARWVLHFSLLSFIMQILYAPYNAMIIAYENMKAYAYISIIEVFFKLGIVYLLVLSSFDKLSFYSFLLLCISIVIASIYICYCYGHYNETHFDFKPNRKLFSELVSYSSWTMFGTLSGVVNQQGTSILLNIFYGPVANASQSVANQVSHALQLFASNIYTAVRPPITKKYATGNYNDVLDLFYISSKYSFFLLYLIMLPLFFEIHFILLLWLGQVTTFMIDFSRLMLIYVIVLSVSNPISIVVQASGDVKRYHGIVDSFTLLTLVVAYFFFLAKAPAHSVFIIMIVIFCIAHLFRLVILKNSISFSYGDYVKYFIIPCSVVTSLSLIPLLFVHYIMEESWQRFVLTLSLSIIFVSIFVYIWGMNKLERTYLRTKLKRFVND